MSTTETPAAAPRPNGNGRRRNLLLLALLVLLAGGGYGAYWYTYARHYQSTDDAYVSSDIVQITSEVPGTVIALHVDDTQNVGRDQALLELDPADARVAMSGAEANLARAVRQVRTLFAQTDQLRAQIAERETELKRADDDYRRRAGLVSDGAVSSEELSHAKDNIAQLRASLTAAREELNATTAQIDGTTVPTHPQVLAAETAVRDAALALRRTHITAPLAGVVARRSVQLGQRVAPGTPLLAVVPLEDAWVDANFKEVQLQNMRVGQPVTLRADLYGGGMQYHGRLAGLAAGSGTAFALLPAQNASGNWIKIVQRVPVRIALDPQELQSHPLRVGLSMTARVDVHDTSGALIAGQVRSQPLPAQASLADDPAVEARIAQIVAANAGGSLVAAAAHSMSN
ncbi:MAG: HlyD family efflux transporter periplasmic adaptor subunit [Nevskia sp.]|nr:HlyD family efflux transporter periplasmic adaptor subunit [Nevskia sp.]